ncbi:tripartite motif-containing protein 16-like protein [Plectropomus leopardus]|uniref:tripartite motif-containing protein 16-like protein n=1 Tax=Plectropomus leopardus TaxID=160734 RepID=UPI001C4C29B6|nr:tripartite motif-containing protein 16-like protein [Plectropomus leopardus]
MSAAPVKKTEAAPADEDLREKLTDVSLTGTEETQPEPKTRAQFLKLSREMSLDPNTAFTQLLLSEDRNATVTEEGQSYPDHPDRFTECLQVLSRDSLTGRCYWEVGWTGSGLCLAVAYESISRSGDLDACRFGFNDKSWALFCDQNSYYFIHNKVRTQVSGPVSSRVGVYLDHGAGILSFYSVSETRTLLHRVQTIFTQPLHAGLWPYFYGDSAELSPLR